MSVTAVDVKRAQLALRTRALQLGLSPNGAPPAAGSMREFVQRRNPTLLRFEHIPRLVDVADRIVRRELRHVIVVMPPRYLKTETFSRLLSAAFLRQNPELYVGLSSYGASLSWDISSEARDYFTADGGQLRLDTSAKKYWRTAEGGGMWAVGVGGPMLGFGFHLGIIDDPTDPEKAHSPAFQKRFQEWYPSKFLSRREPGASIVVVMQRLGTEDPIDFLFRRELGEDGADLSPQNWHVVFCDEIKSSAPIGRWSGPQGLPPTCTLEPDPRKEGEILAPSRFDRKQVEESQRGAGVYVAAAQRQGRPAAPSGDFWKEEWFETYDKLPADAHNGGKDWDLAYTKEDHNSASAYVESYRGVAPDGVPKEQFPIYIENLGFEWLEFPELVEWMEKVGGPHYVEAKASGKSAVQTLSRNGIAAKEVKVEGDKLARASSVQNEVSNRRVLVNKKALRKLLHADRQGLLRVTAENLASSSPKDTDLNDAFVEALTRHLGRKKKRAGVWFPGADNRGKEDAA